MIQINMKLKRKKNVTGLKQKAPKDMNRQLTPRDSSKDYVLCGGIGNSKNF